MPRPKLARKEISHILGLKDNPFDPAFENEGWSYVEGRDSIKNRYENLTNGRQLAFDPLLDPVRGQTPKPFIEKIKGFSIGDYHGFATMWQGHAFSLQVMKDKNGTHFVYINRGRPHIDVGPESDATVRVFTVPDDHLEKFSKQIYAAFTSENRDTVSKFIEANKSYSTAPSKLQKSNQKVGNCSIANSNIAWHFQLASDYLKENPSKTYEEALIATKEAYRELRKQDRINAFKDLLALQPDANYSKDAYMNDVLQAIDKLNRKSGAKGGPNYIQLLLEDPEVRTKLTRILTQSDFKDHLDKFIGGIKGSDQQKGIRQKMEDMRDKILSTSFAKLPRSEQGKLIQQDPSLQKYFVQKKNTTATKEQLAQLLREFDCVLSPEWSSIIRDQIGQIGIRNTPPNKPGIETQHHKIELNNDGSFNVLNKPSFQENTNKKECEKIINDVLKRIPEDVIIPKLKSVPLKSTYYDFGKKGEEGRHHWLGNKVDPKNFRDLKAEYQLLKGDHLKSEILNDFKNQIEHTSDITELAELKNELKAKPEYKVLEKSQGLFTKDGNTSSVQAFEQMFEEQERNINIKISASSI